MGQGRVEEMERRWQRKRNERNRKKKAFSSSSSLILEAIQLQVKGRFLPDRSGAAELSPSVAKSVEAFASRNDAMQFHVSKEAPSPAASALSSGRRCD